MGQVQTLSACLNKNANQERYFPNLATLPPEMAQFVLSYLNATDLCLAACVWEQLGNDDLLWQGYVIVSENNLVLLCKFQNDREDLQKHFNVLFHETHYLITKMLHVDYFSLLCRLCKSNWGYTTAYQCKMVCNISSTY